MRVLSGSAIRLLLLAILGVSLYAGSSFFLFGNLTLQTSAPARGDCPELRPMPNITVDEAVAVMSESYSNSPRYWTFQLRWIVKFCMAGQQWWSSRDGGTWQSISIANIPQVIRDYALRTRTDLVFYVILANAGDLGIPELDDGWIDGNTSRLVARFIVAE